MAVISNTVYSIEKERKVNWSVTQENSLSSDFPFDLHDETPEEFAYRTYLQFLWLPESIMPLQLLVPALRRITASSSSATHPLHGLLDDILLTVPTMTNKYRKELTNILVNGGGAGEMEEGMMWFALTHEKADMAEPWLDTAWRDQWLDRLERREVQIQIMLYLLKLSLPAPPIKPKGKRGRSSSSEITTEEYAEAFMDKMSMWQLLNAIQSSKNDKDDGRDWMQVFCEETVEPETLVPEQCQLLRSKVFPHSPFSDNDSDASTERASSPASESQPKPALSRSNSRRASPKTSKSDDQELARARSRSLSVSLARERGSANPSAAASKRRVVTREISMSRVFKPKGPQTAGPSLGIEKAAAEAAAQSQAESQAKIKDHGVTLVEDTPVKPREPSRGLMSFGQPASRPIFPPVASSSSGFFGRRDSVTSAATDNDDAWQISSSPDIMMLESPTKLDDDGDLDMLGTPSKPSKKRKVGRR